jgi:hypothetical protein
MKKLRRPDAITVSNFIQYVLKVYTEEFSETFVPPITMDELWEATNLLLANYDLADRRHPMGRTDGRLRFDGGSHDREIVRDIVLAKRGAAVAELEHSEVVRRMLKLPDERPAWAVAMFEEVRKKMRADLPRARKEVDRSLWLLVADKESKLAANLAGEPTYHGGTVVSRFLPCFPKSGPLLREIIEQHAPNASDAAEARFMTAMIVIAISAHDQVAVLFWDGSDDD